MSGYGYKSPAENSRARGGEEGTDTRAEREAAKKEAERQRLRLERLAKEAEQSTGYATNTAQYVDATFDPTGGIGGSGTYAKPSSEETFDSTPVTYEELFADSELVAEREAFEKKENEEAVAASFERRRQEEAERLSELGFDRTPTSIAEAKAVADAEYVDYLKQSLNNEDLTNSEKNKIKSLIRKGALDFDKKEDFETYHSVQEWRGGKNRFGWEQHKEELNTVEEIHSRAFDAQRLSMTGYLDRNNIDSYGEETYTTGANVFGEGSTMSTRYVLNTGTALDAQSMNPNAENFTIGEVGTYGNIAYWDNQKPKDSGTIGGIWQDIWEVGLDVLSVVYPPVAPLFQAAKAVIQGATEFEDIGGAAVKTFAGQKLANLTDQNIIDGFDAAGVDISSLPVPAQTVIIDTSKAVLKGDSGSDEFKKSATGALIDSIDIDIDLPDTDFKTPQVVKDLGNAIVSGVEAVGDVAEDILKPPLDFIGETFEEGVDFVADTLEPAVDFLDEKLDALGESYVDPALQAAKEAGQNIIDPVDDVLDEFGRSVVDPALQATKEFGEDVIDAVDTGLDYLGDTYVDPALQAGKEFGQDVIDLGSDVLSEAEDILIEPIKEGVEALSDVSLPDIDLPDYSLPSWDLPDFNLPDFDINFSLPSRGSRGMLLGIGGEEEETETEKLFDKDLFKFDTEIKSSGLMFNPRTNLRKYG